MKSLLPFIAVLAAGTLLAQESPVPASSPADEAAAAAEVSARSKALDLAGAFTNDGYKIRDGFWSGNLETDRPRFLEVNLFAGNEYWFCAAASNPARKLQVSIFDEKGKPVESQTYTEEATAAVGVEPETSGKYILRVDLLEGEKAPFCLIYTYK